MAKASTLVDNFNDDQINATLWTVSPSASPTIAEVNGRVEIRPLSNTTGVYQYTSVSTYDLTDSFVRVELVHPLRAAPSTSAYLVASEDSSNYVSLYVHNGLLTAAKGNGGTATVLRSIPYVPALHRWLQISEQGGVTRWEVSADGVRYDVLVQEGDSIAVAAVELGFGAAVLVAHPTPGFAVFDNFNVLNTSLSRRVEERRLSARAVRGEAAQVDAERLHDEHFNNNDETNYENRPFIGNYSKGLKHDDLGDPDPISYGTLLRALESRDPHDFEEIDLGPGGKKFTNPQAGLAFDLEGPDAQEITQPPAPRFDSAVTAHEAGELYWMAVARDVPFVDYGTNADIAAAISSLNSEFPQFGGTTPVTAQNVFRGIYPGEQVGPYVSQFLVKGNVDTRKPSGLGLNAVDGYISYGSRVINQRLFPATTGVDYLNEFASWLDVQNGVDLRGTDTFETTRVFIRDLRAGTTLVHFDQVLDAWYNAAWILMSEPVGNQSTGAGATGIPQVTLEFPKNAGNPYDPPGTALDSRTQVGFATFGPPHLLQVLGETLGRALRAVWYQKWFVHRRLRPEEYGGRVHNQVSGDRSYPLDDSIVDSMETGGLSTYFGPSGAPLSNGTYLLPQAYAEGAPTHPAYGAGHATGSGALATILKAFFDETKAIENPVQSSDDGLSLIAYTGGDAGSMTVGGELNKLAGNIAIFRNAAGVHWRSDYTESLLLGEAVAIGLLQEQSLGFNEDDGYFQLTRFDGVTIRIFDGQVVEVV